MLFRVIWVFC